MRKAAVVGLVIMAAGIAACGTTTAVRTPRTSTTRAGENTEPRVPASVPSSTIRPSPASALVSAALPLRVCPTTYAIASPPATAVLPPTRTESVPRGLASQLAVYSDQQGTMQLLGPTGWICSAAYGADGSGGVTVHPSGEVLPTGTMSPDSTVEVVDGTESSACFGCTVGQACRLFPAAAAVSEADFPAANCTRAAGESVSQISNGVVGFLDPPGVVGDGSYSGGSLPANGVMTYYGNSGNGSWEETCVLSESQHAWCTAILDDFVQMYGRD